jgi:hypothetical protein
MAYPNIDLGEEVTLKNIPGTIKSFVIDHVLDDPSRKLVLANVTLNNGIHLSIELWKNEAYDAAGQWTDTSVEQTILPLVKQKIASFPTPPHPVKPFVPVKTNKPSNFPGLFKK